MTPSGESSRLCPDMRVANLATSTLATDRGFKERVSEDMLVRLLDAFVWRNHGESCATHTLRPTPHATQTDKRMISSGSRTCRA